MFEGLHSKYYSTYLSLLRCDFGRLVKQCLIIARVIRHLFGSFTSDTPRLRRRSAGLAVKKWEDDESAGEDGVRA